MEGNPNLEPKDLLTNGGGKSAINRCNDMCGLLANEYFGWETEIKGKMLTKESLAEFVILIEPFQDILLHTAS